MIHENLECRISPGLDLSHTPPPELDLPNPSSHAIVRQGGCQKSTF
jgi:hypothetical protein